LFRRNQRQAEAAAEAARETERRALFEQLAQRPETVCPFLGLADDRVGYRAETTPEHRCYAFGEPAPLSAEQQGRVCLQRGYGNCPRYLRGVLVIPTDELEALRRMQPMPAPPAPVAASSKSRRRGAPLILGGILALLLAAGGAGFLLIRGNPGVGVATSPTPSGSQSIASASAGSTGVTTPTPEPTPAPADVFDHYEVSVAPGDYRIYELDGQGRITSSRAARFSGYSFAVVRLVKEPVRSWLVLTGGYTGHSYLVDRSGPFRIREVYRGPNGERRVKFISADQR
jgi:hypothetical protein